VRGACDLLGLDPRMCQRGHADRGRRARQSGSPSKPCARTRAAGRSRHQVGRGRRGRQVLLQTAAAGTLLDMLAGEQLPRIC
jgi:hypothetical protein